MFRRKLRLVGILHPSQKDGKHPKVPKLDRDPDRRDFASVPPFEVLDELIL